MFLDPGTAALGLVLFDVADVVVHVGDVAE
jgi:hypothetical protein